MTSLSKAILMTLFIIIGASSMLFITLYFSGIKDIKVYILPLAIVLPIIIVSSFFGYIKPHLGKNIVEKKKLAPYFIITIGVFFLINTIARYFFLESINYISLMLGIILVLSGIFQLNKRY